MAETFLIMFLALYTGFWFLLGYMFGRFGRRK